MIDIRADGYHLQELLAAPPKIDDPIDGICRTLAFTLKGHKLETGQLVELYFKGKREFYGHVRRRKFSDSGTAEYTAYDPLFLLKNEDDYYFKNQTLTQIYEKLLKDVGISVGNIPNTKAVLPQLWYRSTEAAKCLTDVLARQKRLNNKIYYPRFNPRTAKADLFAMVIPSELWAFQVGVNLTGASFEEDATAVASAVKLVNRETGKTVVKINAASQKKYGKLQKIEEVDKAEEGNMDSLAQSKVNSLSKVGFTASADGINPGTMPIFRAADLVYVEEKFTGLLGGYHIRNVSQSFVDDKMVQVGLDIQKTAFVPDIQVSDATKDPDKKESKPINLESKIKGVNYTTGWKATAYAPALGGINGSGTGLTASSTKVVEGRTIATDPSVIPTGSIVAIYVSGAKEYSGIYLAEDTGGAIKGKKVDIAVVASKAKAFGVKSIQVAILEKGKGRADARNKAKKWDSLEKTWTKKLQKMADNAPASSSKSKTQRENIVDIARSFKGQLSYSWGGKVITNGKGDCSGFTAYVFKKIGVSLGHGTMTQIKRGHKVSSSQAQPGDLVFFKGTIGERGPNAVSHVGIVTKPGTCVSLGSSKGCTEHSYTTGYWGQHFMEIRSVLK